MRPTSEKNYKKNTLNVINRQQKLQLPKDKKINCSSGYDRQILTCRTNLSSSMSVQFVHCRNESFELSPLTVSEDVVGWGEMAENEV